MPKPIPGRIEDERKLLILHALRRLSGVEVAQRFGVTRAAVSLVRNEVLRADIAASCPDEDARMIERHYGGGRA